MLTSKILDEILIARCTNEVAMHGGKEITEVAIAVRDSRQASILCERIGNKLGADAIKAAYLGFSTGIIVGRYLEKPEEN